MSPGIYKVVLGLRRKNQLFGGKSHRACRGKARVTRAIRLISVVILRFSATQLGRPHRHCTDEIASSIDLDLNLDTLRHRTCGDGRFGRFAPNAQNILRRRIDDVPLDGVTNHGHRDADW